MVIIAKGTIHRGNKIEEVDIQNIWKEQCQAIELNSRKYAEYSIEEYIFRQRNVEVKVRSKLHCIEIWKLS